MSGDVLDLSWQPPGPIAARFMASTAMVQIINGPIGSGKTTAALMKSINIAAEQLPSRKYRGLTKRGDRVPLRRFKLAVIRDTYRQLWRTTLPSWFRRVPQSIGDFHGAQNAPATHRINFGLDAGRVDETIVDFTAEFGAIGEQAAEDFMRGYEPTIWYLNELDLLPKEVLGFAQDRAGRFPEMDDGGPTWRGVLADCNAPEFESWLYQDVFNVTPARLAALGAELFVQPGGRDAGAENLANLPADYYKPKIGQADWYVARMLDNRPGYSRAGKPIYPEFNDRLHVAAQELAPIPHLPLTIGIDAGGSPAATFGQRLPNGRRLTIDELVTEHGTGPLRFGDMLAQRLHDRFSEIRTIRGYADPSAAYGADKEAGEQDWIQIVAHKAGIRIDAAPTNSPALRWDAVRRPLTTLIDGEPAYQLSPRCTMLRGGFNAGYRFRKLVVPGADRYGDQADKNDFSHVHDAEQYRLLADDGYLEVMDRKKTMRSGTAQREAGLDHDPLS